MALLMRAERHGTVLLCVFSQAIRAEHFMLLQLTVVKENVLTAYYALLISTSSLPVILTYFY